MSNFEMHTRTRSPNSKRRGIRSSLKLLQLKRDASPFRRWSREYIKNVLAPQVMLVNLRSVLREFPALRQLLLIRPSSSKISQKHTANHDLDRTPKTQVPQVRAHQAERNRRMHYATSELALHRLPKVSVMLTSMSSSSSAASTRNKPMSLVPLQWRERVTSSILKLCLQILRERDCRQVLTNSFNFLRRESQRP